MKSKMLFLVVLLSFTQIVKSENCNRDFLITEQEYYQLLESSLFNLKACKDDGELLNAINGLKRLDHLYPDYWLSDYYIAYYQIQLAFYSDEKSNEILNDAFERIERLERNSKANQSEVSTLKGYYYYALIAQNPAANGQKYYREVIASYRKAIILNSRNPRPAFLLFVFKNKMAAMTGESFADQSIELEKIQNLFAKFSPAHKLEPNWGMNQFKQYKKKYQ